MTATGNRIYTFFQIPKNMSLKNKLIQLSIFMLGIIMGPTAAIAEAKDALVLITNDGHKTTYALSDEPTISFSENNLVIKSGRYELSFPLSSVKDISYQTVGSLEQIDMTHEPPFVVDDNILHFSGLGENTTVTIHSVDGRLIAKPKISSSGPYKIDLKEFIPGVYIVTVNNTSYKIIKE